MPLIAPGLPGFDATAATRELAGTMGKSEEDSDLAPTLQIGTVLSHLFCILRVWPCDQDRKSCEYEGLLASLKPE